ncbi:MAG: long-chain-fatty-acid--CoA ligase [Chloroflexi bacterium]|nr:long-chain-fatty-acid--CoA ligase [Chloroflexota bacterium]
MKTSELLDITAAIVPDREAVIFEGQRYTYEQTGERTRRLGNALANLGVQKEDRVAILQVNCPQYLETYYATSKLGAIFVPLNFRAKAEELTYMLNTAEANTLLVGSRYLDMVDAMRPQLPHVKHYITIESPHTDMTPYEELLASASDDEIFADVDDDDTSILMYTAGTTGFPKGVMLSHNSFTLYVLENVNPADPETHELNLLAIPLYHVAGMQGMLSSTYAGRTIVMLRQFETQQWLEAVTKEKVTHSVLVPTMLKQIVDNPDFTKYDLSSIRQLTYGAASMPLETIKKASELMPKVRFINAFGQTETASTITTLSPEDHIIEGTEEEKEKKLRRLSSSIGRAMSDVEIQIWDEDGNLMSSGEVGEIVARGPRVMKGYWKQPEATASTITTDGWVRTGDMGYMDEEGYIYLAGRAKDMIIRGGENISPEEVERVLHSHPAVEEAAVIGIPDPEWGETVRAIVVLKKGQTSTQEEIIEHCRAHMSSFKKPESVIFLDSLPRNPMGKVLKRVLREEHGAP